MKRTSKWLTRWADQIQIWYLPWYFLLFGHLYSDSHSNFYKFKWDSLHQTQLCMRYLDISFISELWLLTILAMGLALIFQKVWCFDKGIIQRLCFRSHLSWIWEHWLLWKSCKLFRMGQIFILGPFYGWRLWLPLCCSLSWEVKCNKK